MTDNLEQEEVVEVEETEVESVDEEVETEETEETEEKPLWLQDEEDQTSSESMPVSAHIKAKKKLKGQINEQNEELESLRQKIAELEQQKPKVEAPTKRPRLDDFDSDEEYEAALDKYEEDRLAAITSNLTQTQEQKKAQQRAQEELAQSVEGHYERASKLIEEHSISPEVYKQADTTVRQTMEAIKPGMGDTLVDHLISVVGEGSEKVLFHLGRNKTALAEFQSIMLNDPSGLKAAVYLGKQSEKINGTKKRTSRAPAPAPSAHGDEGTSSKEKAFKRKYDAEHKKGNVSKAFQYKQEAKRAGLDTSKW